MASPGWRSQLRAISLIGALLLLTVAAVQADFAVAWESSVDSGGTDRAKAIGYTTSGDVIVACQIGGSGSTANFRVVRLNGSTGAEVWHTDVDSASSDDANDMVVDPATGDAYICGRTSVTGQGLNWIVFKIRGSDGQRMWTYTWDNASQNDESRALCFTSDGNVAVAGMFSLASYTPQGRVIKLSANDGTLQWAYNLGVDWTDLYDVAGDSSGNVIATGTSGSVSTADGYVTKLTSAGAHSWTKTYNRAGDFDTFTVVTVDASGNIIIGGGARTTSTTTTQDFLVIKYTSSGNQSWVALINGSANLSDACYGVTTDTSGDVYATGGIRNASDQNAYIAKLNGATGAVIWDEDRGGSASGTDNFRAVRVAGSGVITAGQFANANGDIGVAQFNTATGAQDWLVYFNSTANVSDNQYFKRQMTVVDANNVFVCGDSSGNGIVAKVVPAAPVNTAPTVNANTGLVLNEGTLGSITASQLDFNDAQQADTAITYTLTALPANGQLLLNGVALALNGTFTQANINSGALKYAHDGTDTASDSFTFTVSDGAGGSVAGQTFALTITAVNDATALAANPTVTFSSAPGGSFALDGQGGSTDVSGIALETYFTDGSLNRISNNITFEDPYAAGTADSGLAINYGGSGGSHYIILKSRNNGDNFWLQSLQLTDYGGNDVKIEAFDNGVSQGSVNVTVNTSPWYFTLDQNGALTPAIFRNADEIRINGQDSGVIWITLNDVKLAAPVSNHAPTDIALSNSSVNQSGGANATVGTLSTTDADAGDTHTYSLVAGTGSTDNASFNISGSTLRANNATVLAAGNYSVRIRTDDGNGGTYEEAFTLTVVDNIAPTVTSVSVPGNATYRIGQNLDFGVNFSEPVLVSTGSGTPRVSLSLDTGGTVYASYVSGSGTTALTFRYAVVSGNADATGITVGSLSLNGGTMQDAANNPATLTLNSVASTAGVLVDGVPPTVLTVQRKTPLAQTVDTNVVVFELTFSEAVTGLTTNWFTLVRVNGGTVAGTVASISGGPLVYQVAVNITSGTGDFRLVLTNAPVTVSTFASGFNQPIGLAFDSAGNLYVSSHNAGTVQKVASGGFVSTFATGFSQPAGLAFDTAGNLYVANFNANYISKVTSGGAVSTFATVPNRPEGLVFDAAGNLYVTSGDSLSYNISKVTSSGVVSTFATGFNNPRELDIDPAGNLYVANLTGGTISKVTTAGTVSTFASGLSGIFGVKFDKAGVLYATRTSGVFLRLAADGTATTVASSGFSSPTGLAMDAAGDFYTANAGNNTVGKIVVPYLNDQSGNNVSGLPYTAGDLYTYAPNHAPTDITLSNTSVNQSAGVNATVGTLSTTDADTGATHTYSLVAGTGSTDNTSFNLSGFTLRANNATALAAGNYSVRIRTDDGNGGTYEEAFTLTVVDDIAPVITSAASTTGTNGIAFSYTITATGSATVFGASGFPLGLNVNTGSGEISGTPAQAGVFNVEITAADAAGNTDTNTLSLTLEKAVGVVSLAGLNHVYDGTSKSASATTTPSGLTVMFTYDGLVDAPTNVGSYTVIGTINDANYAGSATNTLVIGKAAATVLLGNLSQTYGGTARVASASTTPTGLTVDFTYDGSATAPTNVGSYTVIGTINDGNYAGSATNTLVIDKASATVLLGNLSQTYDGTARAASATTTPTGLAVEFTYDGLVDAPTNAGSYTVIGTINDGNYAGSATNTLVIGKASANVLLGNLSQTYDGTARAVSATTTPTGLIVDFTYDGLVDAPTNAGSYTVIGTVNDSNYAGSATNTLVIGKAAATVLLGNLSQTYDGTARFATASTTPTGLTVDFTYDGLIDAPTNAGSYTVIGTINDSNYAGSATNTLVVGKAAATVLLGSLSQTYDGTARFATATTTPTGLIVDFTYDGSATAPTDAGSYTVIGTVNDSNYAGSATNTLVIGKAAATVLLGNLSQTYDGTVRFASATTTPTGLAVDFTYDGSATAPTDAGSYTVIGTVNDSNYAGSATNTLVIGKAAATVLLGNLSQTYDGAARFVSASTTPTGLTVDFTYDGLVDAPTNAGSYTVIGTINDGNYAGSATNTLVIGKATATVLLGNLSQTYDGTARAASASTTPTGLTVDFTYDGSATAPTDAGSYTVIGTVNESNYAGSVTNTLVIGKAAATVLLGNLSQTYDGAARFVSASTTPTGLTVDFTYDGLVDAPTNAGSYTVIGTVNDGNYAGSATNTLVVGKAAATVLLGNLSQTYHGTARFAIATTTPTDLTVDLTYDGLVDAPTNAGSYTAIGTINDGNYAGSATNTLVVGKADATVLLGSLNQTYDGTARVASASTTPTGLTVDFTYDGLVDAPTNSGSYTVIGTVNDSNYAGSATNTLVIGKADVSIALHYLEQSYSGTARRVTASTVPSGFTVNVTYDGLAFAPTNAGRYTVVGTVTETNYNGSVTNTLVVVPANATITLGDLEQVYSGTARTVSSSTAPSGLAVKIIYDGSPTPPIHAGRYTVIGTVNDANYAGNATCVTLVVAPKPLTVSANNTNRLYGEINPPFTLRITGFVNGEDSSVLTELPVAATTATAVSPAGTYPITLSGGSASNYALVRMSGSLTVEKAALTIRAGNVSRSYGTTNPAFDGTITGTVNGDVIAVRYTTAATSNSPAGNYPIVPEIVDPSGAAASYNVTLVNGTLTVTADDAPVITLATNPQFYTYGTDACVVDDSAVVMDGGSLDFAGGTLSITIATNTAATDRLFFKSEGAGESQISLAEGTILYGSTVIGAFSDGPGANAVVVAFNTNATPAAAQALIRRLVFAADTTNTTHRVIEMMLADGDGGISAPAQRRIELNHAPVTHAAVVTVSQNADTFIPFSCVLSNATDLDGDAVTVAPLDAVTTRGGRVTATNSSFIYRSPAGFTGEDLFTYRVTDGRGGEAGGILTVWVVPKDELVIDRPANEEGSVRLKMGGEPNQAYRIDVSVDLVNWSVLLHVTASPTGLIEILDAGAKNSPQRFYRAVAE